MVDEEGQRSRNPTTDGLATQHSIKSNCSGNKSTMQHLSGLRTASAHAATEHLEMQASDPGQHTLTNDMLCVLLPCHAHACTHAASRQPSGLSAAASPDAIVDDVSQSALKDTPSAPVSAPASRTSSAPLQDDQGAGSKAAPTQGSDGSSAHPDAPAPAAELGAGAGGEPQQEQGDDKTDAATAVKTPEAPEESAQEHAPGKEEQQAEPTSDSPAAEAPEESAQGPAPETEEKQAEPKSDSPAAEAPEESAQEPAPEKEEQEEPKGDSPAAEEPEEVPAATPEVEAAQAEAAEEPAAAAQGEEHAAEAAAEATASEEAPAGEAPAQEC